MTKSPDIEALQKLLAEDDDHMVATGDDLTWLIEQSLRWPIRVHPERTTNDRFLRFSMAATLLDTLTNSAGLIEGEGKSVEIARRAEARLAPDPATPSGSGTCPQCNGTGCTLCGGTGKLVSAREAMERVKEEEVEQTDREAAADYYKAQYGQGTQLEPEYRSGERDGSCLVLAFARHRRAALSARPGEVALREALEQMVAEKCDYMRINNLGDPETQHTVKAARAALGQEAGCQTCGGAGFLESQGSPEQRSACPECQP